MKFTASVSAWHKDRTLSTKTVCHSRLPGKEAMNYQYVFLKPLRDERDRKSKFAIMLHREMKAGHANFRRALRHT